MKHYKSFMFSFLLLGLCGCGNFVSKKVPPPPAAVDANAVNAPDLIAFENYCKGLNGQTIAGLQNREICIYPSPGQKFTFSPNASGDIQQMLENIPAGAALDAYFSISNGSASSCPAGNLYVKMENGTFETYSIPLRNQIVAQGGTGQVYVKATPCSVYVSVHLCIDINRNAIACP